LVHAHCLDRLHTFRGDALVFKLEGRSLVTGNRLEFVIIVLVFDRRLVAV